MKLVLTKKDQSIIVGSKLQDDLNILANGRVPQYFGKWKSTSIFWLMEDDLNPITYGGSDQR